MGRTNLRKTYKRFNFFSVLVTYNFESFLLEEARRDEPYAEVSTLIIDVKLEAQYTSGFKITLYAFGEAGLTFKIEKGESVWVDAWGNEYPAVYWKIIKV